MTEHNEKTKLKKKTAKVINIIKNIDKTKNLKREDKNWNEK